MGKLAIRGGIPVRSTPFPSGKKVGKEELKELTDVIESGHLFRWGGTKVPAFERGFADLVGRRFAVASTSGTAAIHVAIGMVGPDPAEEIITGPITDIGTVIPILAQNAIPVFADLQPDTFNLDPQDVEAKISDRTRAIIPVHLFGNASDMEGLMAVARKRGIPVLEDCSQAHLCEYRGKRVGTFGEVGCFSLQQSKHMTTGDGGVTVTDDEALASRGALFADKGWFRKEMGPRQYVLLGMNYRMTELQGAVALAQLRRVEHVVGRRRTLGDQLTSLIRGIPGIAPQKVIDGCKHSYWLYAFLVTLQGGLDASRFAEALSKEGIPASAGYIGKPIFLCHEALRTQQVYGSSHFPFDHPRARKGIEYAEGVCPVAEDILRRIVILPLNEFWTEEEVKDSAEAIHKVAEGLP